MKSLFSLLVALAFASPIFAAEPSMKVNGNVIEIRGYEAAQAVDAVNDLSHDVKNNGKMIVVYVPPMPELTLAQKAAMVRGKKAEQAFSSQQSLLEEYRQAQAYIMEEMGETASATDVTGNLEKIEKYLGLDEVNPKNLRVTQRSYRICWVYEINRFVYSDQVQIVFE